MAGAGLNPKTLPKYIAQFYVFLEWAEEEPDVDAVRSAQSFDRFFARYVEFLWDSGAPLYRFTYVYSLFKHICPRLHAGLVDCRYLLNQWQKAEAPSVKHYPPVPVVVLWKLVCYAMEQGEAACGFAWVVVFYGVFRVHEFVNLTVGRVVLPATAKGSAATLPVVSLGKTKTAAMASMVWPRLGAVAAELLSQWVHVKQREGVKARLFPDDAYQSRKLKKFCAELGLSSCGFVLRSFRAGGACFYLLRGMAMKDLLKLGRWRVPLSAEPYLQALPCVLSELSLPAGAEDWKRLSESPLESVAKALC